MLATPAPLLLAQVPLQLSARNSFIAPDGVSSMLENVEQKRLAIWTILSLLVALVALDILLNFNAPYQIRILAPRLVSNPL